MKKKIIIAISVIILLLSGCNAGVISTAETTVAAKVTTATTTTVLQTETKTTKKAETTAKQTTAKQTSEKQTTETETTKKTPQPARTETKATQAKKEKKKAPDSKATTIASSTATAETTEKNEIYCTLTIECKTILSNMNRLKTGHEPYVPSSGIILSEYKYEPAENDTVYDVLKKACEENGINLTAKPTQYGTYVSGINNLDEFDVGRNSGWMYYVNGKAPGVSCSSFRVKGGDKIVFHYTTEEGD